MYLNYTDENVFDSELKIIFKLIYFLLCCHFSLSMSKQLALLMVSHSDSQIKTTHLTKMLNHQNKYVLSILYWVAFYNDSTCRQTFNVSNIICFIVCLDLRKFCKLSRTVIINDYENKNVKIKV